MGIRFNTFHSSSTWRAPLQLIDSWLPASAPRSSLVRCLPQVVQRFARAGWLGRPVEVSGAVLAQAAETQRSINLPTAGRSCHLRVLRGSEANSRNDGRLVISGRIGDVCAELERLAALEHQGTALRA